ncbi:MAG: hypothetical protein J0I53_11225 [Chryseobacterium sp.]|nr:hypothetical protein [Chryseobacterium sp.]
MGKILLCITFMFLNTLVVFAQNQKIDSLKNEIKTRPNFTNIHDLAWEYLRINIDTLHYYNKKSLPFIKNDNDRAEYENLLGKYFLLKGNYKDAEKQANKTISISEKNHHIKMLSSAYNTLLITANRTGNLMLAKEFAEKNVKYSLLSGDKSKILNAYLNLGSICLDLNDLESTKKNYMLARKFFNDKNIYEQAVILKNVGLSYNKGGEFSKSNTFLLESEKLFQKAKVYGPLSGLYNIVSNNFRAQKKLETSQKYIETSLKLAKNSDDSTNVFYEYANLMIAKKDFKQAKQLIELSMKIDERNDNTKKMAENYYLLGEASRLSHHFLDADKNYRKAIHLSEPVKDSISLSQMVNSLLMNKLESEKDQYYFNYFQKYTGMLNKVFHKDKIKSILELDVAYNTEKKNQKINTQEKVIYRERKHRVNAYLGLGIFALLSLSGFWFARNVQKQKQLKTQNTLLELQMNLDQMELQSLNKQLDPHEIKNLLANISPEIQEKAPEAYRKMLKLFNITKAALNNNSITDSIANQTQQIDDLLDLEKQMLTVPLEYTIENTVQNPAHQIPRLMLKNLVENAVKHGIKGKENGGMIKVGLSEEAGFIHITVDDTGKGRVAAISTDSGIGTSTYQNLFATLNKKNKEHASFEIFDKSEGTTVVVVIPKEYKYE